MAKDVPLWQSNPVEYLVRVHFPMARSGGGVRLPYGDGDPDSQDMQRTAEEYRNELEKLGRDDLTQRIAEHRELVERAARRKAEREEQARPFNQPGAEANFAHWASASFWTFDEAAALSFGKDPRVVTWKVVSPM